MNRVLTLLGILACLNLCRLGKAESFDNATPDLASRVPVVSQTPFSIFREYRDLRIHFLGVRAIDDAVRRGKAFLITSGSMKDDRTIKNCFEVDLTDSPTVEAVLKKQAEEGLSTSRQIRLIQKHALLQTPVPRDRAARKALLATKLSAGDVVLVTWRNY